MNPMQSYFPRCGGWVLIALYAALAGGCTFRAPPPPKPELSEVAKLSRAAARGYFREVAANYEQLSQEKFATITEAMHRNVELDSHAREHYAAALKQILQPRIVGEQADRLSNQATETFQQMAAGFKEVGFREAAAQEVTP